MKTSLNALIQSELKSKSLTRSSFVTSKPKVLVILGPTASGKSDLAVEIARKYNGEIISADSRQVYKGLNIGAGKITKKEMKGVRHHLLDVAHPKKLFTVDLYKKQADKATKDILKRNKLPIICGGTGFYIQSLVDNIVLPDVPVNPELRKKLLKKSAEELYSMIQKLDPVRAKDLHPHNRLRTIRAIEIVKALGKVPTVATLKANEPEYDFIQIGLVLDEKTLKSKIEKRLLARIKKGMISEVKKLHTQGLSWKRLEMLGLEYREVAKFLQGKITKEQMITTLKNDIWHYAKRQMTWFKRDERIKWFKV